MVAHPEAFNQPSPMQSPSSGVTIWRIIGALPFAAYNLIPLYGLKYWGWDAFQILILYWTETVILAFWALMRIRFLPVKFLGTIQINGKNTAGTYANMIGFFALHAGMFIGAHLVFLLTAFSGDWFSRLNGIGDFFWTFYVASGAWIALLIAFLGGAVAALTGPYHPAFVDRAVQGLGFTPPPPPPPPANNDAVGGIVMGLYVRIVLTQVALIFGAWFSMRGAVGPLIVLVSLKTLFDFFYRIAR
jgi:hypothetical protein